MSIVLDKTKYIPLINDVLFKYLFLNDITRNFFVKVIKHYTGVDLSNLKLIRNEINTGKKNKDRRLDILLEDSTNHIIYNVEMNNSNEKFFIRRNNRYINLLALAVNKSDTEEEYKIVQINLNNYYCNKKRKTRHNHLQIKDEENDVMLENVEYFNIYIPQIIKTCYDNVDKEMNMLVCKSFEELKKYAKSKEGKLVMEKVKGILEQDGFMDFFDYEEDQKILLRDAKREYEKLGEKIGEKRGEKIGEKRGEKRGIEKTARNMLKDGLSIDLIKKYTGLSTSKIKSFML